MGTNFYLKKTTPKLIYDQVHVAKVSWGWKPLFQATPGEIESVADIRRAVESGEYVLVDEYDRGMTWEEFDEQVVHWADVERREGGFEPKGHDSVGLNVRRDPEGHEFTESDFC